MKKQLFLLALLPMFASAQTLVSTSPAQRTALIEEFTAINCGNCPGGHAAAAAIVAQHGADVTVVGVHGGNLANPSGSQPDFRTTDGAALWSQFNVFGQPSAVINRGSVQGTSAWSNSVSNVLTQASPVNIGVSSSFDASANQLSIEVELYYTGSGATPENDIHIMLTESNIVAYQQDYSNGANQNYNHKHVLRDVLTPVAGDAVMNTSMGTLVQRTYNFTVDPSWEMANSHVVAFVSENNGAVYQVKEVDAIGGLTTSVQDVSGIDFVGTPYPMPATNTVTIPLSAQNQATTLQLFDATGRTVRMIPIAANVNQITVDLTELNTGLYYLGLNGKPAKKLQVVK